MDFHKPIRRVDRVVVHCSASDNENLRGMGLLAEVDRWHRARGFSEVGYHYLIDKEGILVGGRNLSKIPAAQRGYNEGSIAIMVHGLEDFPEIALDRLRTVCNVLNEAYGGRLTFHGHREYSRKSCPVFDYKAVLGLDRFGRMP